MMLPLKTLSSSAALQGSIQLVGVPNDLTGKALHQEAARNKNGCNHSTATVVEWLLSFRLLAVGGSPAALGSQQGLCHTAQEEAQLGSCGLGVGVEPSSADLPLARDVRPEGSGGGALLVLPLALALGW